MRLPPRLGRILVAAALIGGATVSLSAAGLEKVHLASGQVMTAVAGQVLVRYRASAAQDGRAKMTALGASVRHQIPALNVDLLQVPRGETVESFITRLSGDPSIEFIEPNGIMKALAFPTDQPNDTDFANQFQMLYSPPAATADSNINIKPAWQITLGDPSVVVAVVDTGADLNNTDLSGNLVQGHRFEIDWLGDGRCTDTPTSQPELGLCPTCAGVGPDQCDAADAFDDNNIDEQTGAVSSNPTYHGTRCSGIIAAKANNGFGIAGVAPNVKIMPLKVLNSWGFGNFSSIAEGIAYAATHGASVINLSLGGTSDDTSGTVQAAVALALQNNCVVVAAAGNSGNLTPVNFPGSLPGVIAVGAIDSAGGLADFSATGSAVDLVAPGEGAHNVTSDGIYGLVPSTVAASGANAARGTSFSSPQVAGVAALIRSVNPSLSWQKVTQYIDFTATPLPAGSAGFNTNYGFGRLNAGAAVAAAAAGQLPVSPNDPGKTYAFPDPFRPASVDEVTFHVPESLGPSGTDTTIDIINVAGEKVRSLSGPNPLTWNGRNDSGDRVASGLYFYFAKTSHGSAKGKLTLIK